MATRFYLPKSGTCPISGGIAAHSNWTVDNISGSSVSWKLTTTKTNTATGTVSYLWWNATDQTAAAQWISDPIAAQTITGNITAVISCKEGQVESNCFFALHLRVINNDGSSTRGVLYDGTGGVGTEMSTSYATRIRSSVALSSVTAQANDRLCLELGFMYNTATSGLNSDFLKLRDDAASDFALTSGLTTDLNPWVEISANITWAPSGVPNQLMLMGVGT